MKRDLGKAPLDIGGWLILMGIHLIRGISANGNSVIQIFNLHLIGIMQAARIVLIFATLYAFLVLIMLLKRHKAFPCAYIVLEVLLMLFNLSIFNIT